MQTVDCLIHCRYVAPVEPPGLLEDHALVIRSGRILALEPAALAAGKYQPRERIERSSHLLVPGFVNAATRPAESLWPAPGLRSPALPDALAAQLAPLATGLAFAELLAAGVTTVATSGPSPRLCADTAREHGMRVHLGLPLSGASSFAGSIDECFEAALLLHDEFRAHPLIGTGFAPDSVSDLDDAALTRLRVLTDQLEMPLVLPVHASRTGLEKSRARFGATPLERLTRLGLWHAGTAALGFRHVGPADVESAQRAGASVVHCPDMDLHAGAELEQLRPGAGLAPVAALQAAGVPLALGSGPRGALAPARLMALAARLAAIGQAPPPGPAEWLRAATLAGARALGLEASVGSLLPGKWADLACIDLRALPPAPDPLAAVLAGAGTRAVSEVWVAGRALLEDGRHLLLDVEALRDRARAGLGRPLAPRS
jgi:5-methylthioadenosine/S-adenosylhomocysteine deaminase